MFLFYRRSKVYLTSIAKIKKIAIFQRENFYPEFAKKRKESIIQYLYFLSHLMIKAVLFDLDDTLYDYEAAHQVALKKVFTKLVTTTGKSVEMLQIVFEISQKEIKRQLVGLSASHNKDLYFQRFFEHLNKEMKNKILPREIIDCYEGYRKSFYKAMRKERATKQLLEYLKNKGIKT